MKNPKEFLQTLLEQKFVILTSVAACAVISMVGFKFVPKRYKVQASITIQTQYFQNPLVRDFLPETFDGAELRSQREAIIRYALNHQYLLKIGKQYDLFEKKPDSEITSYDLEKLSKKFEVVQVGPTSFLLGYFSSNPEIGYKIVQDLIAHIRVTLANERRSLLTRLHDAIQDRLESLSFGQDGGVTSVMAARPDLVKQEIERMEEEIRVLRNTYSDKHPAVTRLTKRIKDLGNWLKNHNEVPATSVRTPNFSGAKVDPASKELFGDLLKKFHYLEVVMYLDEQNKDSYLTLLYEPFVPKAPIWPKRPIFLIWGIATGFLIGTLIVLIGELSQTVEFRKSIAPLSRLMTRFVS